MIGQIIQSYLVSLGVQIDKPGFQQADATIRQTGDNIERITGGMAKNFVKASSIIATAMASVTASAVGLMKATAQEDLAMQKYARAMMMSEDATWKMKKATDALGESINDIALTPELLNRYNKLVADGNQMMIGGDFKETMKNFRDLMFEFTRLKQEASYALNWVGYYLMKYLQRPLADIKEKFKTFNDMVVKNMSVWTEKIARGIYYVLEVGRHFLEFLGDVGRHLKDMWDTFPSGVKKAIVAITALNVVLSAGPLGRAIMLISTLLLLIDDYSGYMEGKDALLGKYWDKLNEYLAIAKQKWEDLKTTVIPMLEDFGNKLEQLGTKVLEAKDKFLEWFGALAESPEVKELAKAVGSLFASLTDLGKEIADVTIKVFSDLFQELKDQEIFERFVKAVTDLVGQFKWLVDLFRDFMGIINDDKALRDIVHDFVALLGVIVDLLPLILDFFIVGRVIKFAGWILKLVKNFGGLRKIIGGVWSAIKGLFDGTRTKGQVFKAFWDSISTSLGGILKKMGKIGAVLLLWAQGKHAEAAKKLGSLFDSDKSSGKGRKGKNVKGAKGVDAFMSAISGQESNDNPDAVNSDSGASGMFQIMPDNWPSWAEAAGLPKDAPQTAENQKIVARHKMLEYYKQFGNWRDVAIAWYGGPGAVNYSEEAKNRPQYYNGNRYPSINEYADSVMDRMAKLGGGDALDYDDEEDDYEVSDEVSPSTGINLRGGKVRIHSSAEGYNAGLDSEVTKTKTMLPRTKEAVNALSLVLPNGLTITGGAEKGYHMEKDEYGNELKYSHVKGYKFDLSFDEIPPGSDEEKTLRRIVEDIYGGRVVQEGDHWDCFIPDGPSKYEEVKQLFGMDTEATASEDVSAAAQWGDNGEQIGYAGGASIANANKELQLRFDDAKGAMRDRGYDFYIQNSTQGSIGFTSPAPDWENIRDVLESYGLSVTHDEHGFYVSLDPNRANPSLERYLKYGNKVPNSGIDPTEIGTDFMSRQKGLNFPMGSWDFNSLQEVKDMLGKLKGQLPTEYLESLSETLEELMAAGGGSDILNAMRGGMPDYGRGGINVGGLNIKIDVGGVTVNGQNMTNADVGMAVAQRTVEKAAEFFEANVGLTLNRMIPTPQMKELFNS